MNKGSAGVTHDSTADLTLNLAALFVHCKQGPRCHGRSTDDGSWHRSTLKVQLLNLGSYIYHSVKIWDSFEVSQCCPRLMVSTVHRYSKFLALPSLASLDTVASIKLLTKYFVWFSLKLQLLQLSRARLQLQYVKVHWRSKLPVSKFP